MWLTSIRLSSSTNSYKPWRMPLQNEYDVLTIDSASLYGGREYLSLKISLTAGEAIHFQTEMMPTRNMRCSYWRCYSQKSMWSVVCEARWLTSLKPMTRVSKYLKRSVLLQSCDGVEYEFTTVLDLDMHHQALVSKDRTGLFGDELFLITEEKSLLCVVFYFCFISFSQSSECC